MPKLKTKKSVKKRFKITKKNRLIHVRSGKVIAGKRAQKIKRMLGK